jgi:hypothetical protein
MKYIDGSVCSALPPKLLGTYELEIAHIIEELCGEGIGTVVDVGAAEGYYSTGMALRLPHAQIVAFETTAEGQESARRMAGINGVSDRVSVAGYCDTRTLRRALQAPAPILVIMDIEGGEDELLRPDSAPELAEAWIIVELHDFIVPGVSSEIIRRFDATHSIERIQTRARTPADLPFKPGMLRWSLTRLLTEFRPAPMEWLYMRPKARSSSNV